jgi:arylsulfatase
MEFVKEKAGAHGESMGTMVLYINDKEVARSPMTAQVGKFTLVGDGLCVGFDSGDPVSKLYNSPGEFKGGEIHFVNVSTGKEPYSDLEKKAASVFATE